MKCLSLVVVIVVIIIIVIMRNTGSNGSQHTIHLKTYILSNIELTECWQTWLLTTDSYGVIGDKKV